MNWIILRIYPIVIGLVLWIGFPACASQRQIGAVSRGISKSFNSSNILDWKYIETDSIPTDSVGISVLNTGNFGYTPFKESEQRLKFIADSSFTAYREKKKLKLVRLMAEGKISIHFFNLDFSKPFSYTVYEGIKLGIGGETNEKLSHHFTVGAATTYGMKDFSLKHAEWINFYPVGRTDLRIHFDYQDMNLEFGGSEFLESKSLLNPESFRNLLITNMFATKRTTVGFEMRPLNDFNFYVFGDLSENRTIKDTRFLLEHPFNPITLVRTGIQLRYSPGIVFELEEGHLNEITAPKSDLYLTLIQGLTTLGGEYRFTKLELKCKFILPSTPIGTTTIVLRGGVISSQSPMIELFNGNGSYTGKFTLDAPFSFGTMQMNEFSATNYTSLNLRHNFSTWLFPTKFKTRPAFTFVQNIGVGRLTTHFLTQLNLRDYRKGFYESGFEINNFIRLGHVAFGAGIFYRYGPYGFNAIHDNFAYKFGFLITL